MISNEEVNLYKIIFLCIMLIRKEWMAMEILFWYSLSQTQVCAREFELYLPTPSFPSQYFKNISMALELEFLFLGKYFAKCAKYYSLQKIWFLFVWYILFVLPQTNVEFKSYLGARSLPSQYLKTKRTTLKFHLHFCSEIKFKKWDLLFNFFSSKAAGVFSFSPWS